jgi:hypothetical protein
MLRKKNIPEDIKLVQSLGAETSSGVIKILDDVNQAYKRILNSCQEDIIKQLSEMGHQKEVGWYLEIISSLRRVQQCTDTELKQMKQALKKSKKQRG